MKSQFITRVNEMLKQGIESPEEMYAIFKPEYDSKGRVITLNHVHSAINCAKNGWYLDEPKQDNENADSSD